MSRSPCCLIVCTFLHVHAHDHSPCVCYDFDLDVHMLSLCCRGSSLWWGLTHWYFSVFHKPYSGVQDFITRRFDRWAATAKSMDMAWEFERGPLPRYSSAYLWVISCDTVSGRRLRPQQQQAIAYSWEEMWRICKHSGEIRIGSGTLKIHEGCVNLSSASLVLAVSDHADTLFEMLAKLKVNMFEVPVPTLALSLERVASLKGHVGSLQTARCLASNFLVILDRFIFQRSASILREELPIAVRYEYRCGRRQTRNDDRMQVGHMLAFPTSTCLSTHCWGVASSPPMVF